jgi:hypothetical protein
VTPDLVPHTAATFGEPFSHPQTHPTQAMVNRHPLPITSAPMSRLPRHHPVRHGLEAQRRWHQANYDATPSDANRYQLVRLERLLESL